MSTNREAEKRTIRRMTGSFGEIALQLRGEAAIHKASVRDFSIQGMGIVADQTAPPGKQVIIHMLHRHKTVKIDAEVRHAKAIDGGQWLLGCHLRRFLSVDDLMGAG